jgi:hypothetical protein
MLVNVSSHSYFVRPFSFLLILLLFLLFCFQFDSCKSHFQPVLVDPIFAMHVSGPRYPLPPIDVHFVCMVVLYFPVYSNLFNCVINLNFLDFTVGIFASLFKKELRICLCFHIRILHKL